MTALLAMRSVTPNKPQGTQPSIFDVGGMR
jgi:hypothetical protein